MSPNSAYQKYIQAEVTTSNDPKRLILMLYDGALSFLAESKKAIEAHDVKRKGVYIGKVIDIVNELSSSLDRNIKDETVEYLSDLYFHIQKSLLEANLKNDTALIDHVSRYIENLKENWLKYVMNAPSVKQGAKVMTTKVSTPSEALTSKLEGREVLPPAPSRAGGYGGIPLGVKTSISIVA